MLMRLSLLLAATVALPHAVGVRAADPVADAFRNDATRHGRILVSAAEAMPADKYAYKPTPAQMSFADIVVHLAEGNDFLCGKIGGATAPERSKMDATASKEQLVARLKETFQFCDSALSKLDDSKLGEELPFFGGRKMTRAGIMTVATGDWADHYSQMAIYLRLNGLLPPTAQRREAEGE